MNLPPQIRQLTHAGHACLQLETGHGTATVALHGAHVLSWQPAGEREVFWLSPQALAEPAAIRGGVPICWPWFARQGMPESAPQHGLARVIAWQVSAVHDGGGDDLGVTLEPQTSGMEGVPPGLQVSMRITMGKALTQTLRTRNLGPEAFQLTQALHSYFSVGDASQVAIEGLTGLPYQDKLRSMAADLQIAPFFLDKACDRIYHHGAQISSGGSAHRYALTDPVWRRRITIDTRGSESVVVWNPGSEGIRKIADLPDDGWRDFFCIEAANAGLDVVTLLPGAEHQLAQTISID